MADPDQDAEARHRRQRRRGPGAAAAVPVRRAAAGVPATLPLQRDAVHGPAAFGAAAYPYYGGGGNWVPAPAPQHLLQYVPTTTTTTWDDGYFPSRQYVPNQAPVCFNDDNPNGCCTVQ